MPAPARGMQAEVGVGLQPFSGVSISCRDCSNELKAPDRWLKPGWHMVMPPKRAKTSKSSQPDPQRRGQQDWQATVPPQWWNGETVMTAGIYRAING